MATTPFSFNVNMHTTTNNNNNNDHDSAFIDQLQYFEFKLDFNLETSDNDNTQWIIPNNDNKTRNYIDQYNNSSSPPLFPLNNSANNDDSMNNNDNNNNTDNIDNCSIKNMDIDTNTNDQIVCNHINNKNMDNMLNNMNISNHSHNYHQIKLNLEYESMDDSESTSLSVTDSIECNHDITNQETEGYEDVYNKNKNENKHCSLLETNDRYKILLDAFLRPFEILLLIPPEIRNLLLLYFRDCTFIYMLNGGKNCGISCISTKDENENKMVNLKIYDIKTYNKRTNFLTSTFMNEWDLNTMKICHGRDINIDQSFIPSNFKSTQHRNSFDILFKAQKEIIPSTSRSSLFYFNQYRITGILINPLNILYHDIEAIQRKNKYIRTCISNYYHNAIKTFEIELPPVADVAGFDMIYSQNNGLVIIGEMSDIQSLKISQSNNEYLQRDDRYQDDEDDVHLAEYTQNNHDNVYDESSEEERDEILNLLTARDHDITRNKPQWRFITELPANLKWKTQRTLGIINQYNDRENTECLFVSGGMNLTSNIPHLNQSSMNTNNISKHAAIYNFNKSKWTELNDLNYGRRKGETYFNKLTQKLFIGGGLNYDSSDIFEIFDCNKYNLKWNILPKSIYKHYEKVSIYQNETISPSLLYCISKYGAEFFDLRANEWHNLTQNCAINSVVQSLNHRPNLSVSSI